MEGKPTGGVVVLRGGGARGARSGASPPASREVDQFGGLGDLVVFVWGSGLGKRGSPVLVGNVKDRLSHPLG